MKDDMEGTIPAETIERIKCRLDASRAERIAAERQLEAGAALVRAGDEMMKLGLRMLTHGK